MTEHRQTEIAALAKEASRLLTCYRDLGVDALARPQGAQGSSLSQGPSPSQGPPAPSPIAQGNDTSANSFAPDNRLSVIPEVAPTLEGVREVLGDCQRCKLWPTRHTIVFGSGNPHATLLFVGEGPGEEEDRQGLPFVGKAGQLLTGMITAMGLTRDLIYIANIVKCRPPRNRPPQPDEIASCQPFLLKQIEAIRPKIICALGTFAAQTLLETKQPISLLRGKFHDFNGTAVTGIQIMPTFHPAYLLRNPPEKKKVWEDLQKIMAKMNLPLEAKERSVS